MVASRIFLVGPMGAGKSTIGRRLAALLDCEFIDSDEEIERRAGADIPWIFDVEGETGFREREVVVLSELALRENVVIATGGGAIMREENRRLMADTGTVVYLHASVNDQVRRTQRDSNRPLLQGRDSRAVLSELMAIREPLYRSCANLVVQSGGGVGRLADRIHQQLMAEMNASTSNKPSESKCANRCTH